MTTRIRMIVATVVVTAMATVGVGNAAFGASLDRSARGIGPVAVSQGLDDGNMGTTGVVTGKCDAPTRQGTVKGYIDRTDRTGEVWGWVVGRGCSLTGKLVVDLYRNTNSGLKHVGGRSVGCRDDYCSQTTKTYKMTGSYDAYCVKITYNFVNNPPAGVSQWVCGS